MNQWSQQKPVLHKTRQRACACASGRDEVRGLGGGVLTALAALPKPTCADGVESGQVPWYRA